MTKIQSKLGQNFTQTLSKFYQENIKHKRWFDQVLRHFLILKIVSQTQDKRDKNMYSMNNSTHTSPEKLR